MTGKLITLCLEDSPFIIRFKTKSELNKNISS